MYSTHAHFAEVGRIVALPPYFASPRVIRDSRASTTSSPANGVPSSGVLRLATNGAHPYATRGWIAASSFENAISSSTSASVSPGTPSIM